MGAGATAGLPADLSGNPLGRAIGGSAGAAPADPAAVDESRPSLWLVAAVSAVSAGLLATGLAMVAVGLLGTNDQLRPVVERLMEPRPIDSEGPADIAAAADRARAAIVRLRIDGSSTVVGSGVVFRSDGHVLTSASVVAGVATVGVTLDSGREITGRVIGSDPATDTAVVKIDDDGPFPTAVLGTAGDLRVGQQAIAIGCPVELVGGPSVTVGVISALHRSVQGADGGMLLDMVQTDARVPTGWPGGALLDSSGSVVGITTSVGTTGTGSGGFGFAIPIDLARSVADQLISAGRVTAVWLGIEGDALDWVAAARLEVPGGVLVEKIMTASPAARAGIEASDVIVSVQAAAVTSMGQLVAALRQHRPGDRVTLDIMRDNRRMSMVVVLVERPVPA